MTMVCRPREFARCGANPSRSSPREEGLDRALRDSWQPRLRTGAGKTFYAGLATAPADRLGVGWPRELKIDGCTTLASPPHYVNARNQATAARSHRLWSGIATVATHRTYLDGIGPIHAEQAEGLAVDIVSVCDRQHVTARFLKANALRLSNHGPHNSSSNDQRAQRGNASAERFTWSDFFPQFIPFASPSRTGSQSFCNSSRERGFGNILLFGCPPPWNRRPTRSPPAYRPNGGSTSPVRLSGGKKSRAVT